MKRPNAHDIEAFLWGERFGRDTDQLIQQEIEDSSDWQAAHGQVASLLGAQHDVLTEIANSDVSIRNSFVINSLLQPPVSETFRDRVTKFVESWLTFEEPTINVFEAIGRRLLIDLTPLDQGHFDRDSGMSHSASYSIESAPIVAFNRSRKVDDRQTSLRQLLVDAFPARYPDLEAAGESECVVRISRGEGLMASLALIGEFDLQLMA